MDAIILSAGQGRRLLPLTESRPKCLLPFHGRALIAWQIDRLLALGIEHVTVVTGFHTNAVERALKTRYGTRVHILFNPFYQVADNLGSCWIAGAAMGAEFVLLNGDTLFEARLLERLLNAPGAAITVTIDHKAEYDDDDMKVRLDGSRLRHIGKSLPREVVDGESVGMLRFQGPGPALFRAAVDRKLHDADATGCWYLAVIDEIAQRHPVAVQSIAGLAWAEVDYAADYESAKALTALWREEFASGARSA